MIVYNSIEYKPSITSPSHLFVSIWACNGCLVLTCCDRCPKCCPCLKGAVLLSMSKSTPPLPQEKPKEYVYDADDFLPLLSYDHGNKTLLDAKIGALVKLILQRPNHSEAKQIFTLPLNFVEEGKIAVLGNALIFWLKIVIEQQHRERRFKITDSDLAKQLKTSRTTVIKYKKELRDLGYLIVLDTGKVQQLSAKYFIKQH